MANLTEPEFAPDLYTYKEKARLPEALKNACDKYNINFNSYLALTEMQICETAAARDKTLSTVFTKGVLFS